MDDRIFLSLHWNTSKTHFPVGKTTKKCENCNWMASSPLKYTTLQIQQIHLDKKVKKGRREYSTSFIPNYQINTQLSSEKEKEKNVKKQAENSGRMRTTKKISFSREKKERRRERKKNGQGGRLCSTLVIQNLRGEK